MKSVRLQLLVTVAAVAMAVGLFVAKGLPPQKNLRSALMTGLLWRDNYDRPEIMRYLNWGGNPNQGPLLHYAISRRDVQMVELAISLGADVNESSDLPDALFVDDAPYYSPLSYAKYLGFEDMVQILRKHGGKEYVLSPLALPWTPAPRTVN